MSASHACRALVKGRVQGVNFRAFVYRRATGLGLAGYARNLPDGTTVEVYAEGEESSLKGLLSELRRGPSLARVEAVEESWLEPRGGFDGFQII